MPLVIAVEKATNLDSLSLQGVRWESNPYLLVHSQVCSDLYTTDTIAKKGDGGQFAN
jgi:hypothetical protein